MNVTEAMVRNPNREEEIAIRRWENEGGEIPELAAISNRSELTSVTLENHTPSSQSVKAEAHRKIIGFHQDGDLHWVVELECGHQQHIRHDPPLTNREWVKTDEGRKQRIGHELRCKSCETQSSVLE